MVVTAHRDLRRRKRKPLRKEEFAGSRLTGAVMDITLSLNQKEEIRKLLSIQADEDEHFFLNLEHLLENTFLPPKGSRKVILKEKIALMNAISRDTKKLVSKLNRLDRYFVKHVDCKLGQEFSTPYPQGTEAPPGAASHRTMVFSFFGGPNLIYPSISTKRALEIISEEFEFSAWSWNEQYGGSYMEVLIDSLATAFPHGRKITASVSSDFVKFVGIVLEEDSLEKVYQQVLRSKRFAGIKKASRTFRNKSEK
jgi:hypothetical protein